MKLLTISLALLISLLVTLASNAAEIVLREQATQHGSIIRLGDLADISARTSAELHNLSSTPLLAAPAPGTHQYLSALQVRELLVTRGITLEGSSLRGAKSVRIGTPYTPTPSTTTSGSASKVTAPTKKSPEQVEQLIKETITRHLQELSNHYDWRVELSLKKDDFNRLANLADNVTASGARHSRTGRQRFTLNSNGKNHFVTANVAKLQSVVVVKNPIEKGQLIRTVDVEIRQRHESLPREVLVDLEQAIGKEALRTLPADEVLQQRHVREPWQVQRDQPVNVYVRTGGIVVRTRAIAKENGAHGDLISVELVASGDRSNRRNEKQTLDVTVSGPGEVVVFATGGQATDFASLDRRKSQRR